MRLAQLARKVKVQPTEVKRFLESEFDLTIGKDPNFKLDEDHIEAVITAFPIPVEPITTTKTRPTPLAEEEATTVEEAESPAIEETPTEEVLEEENTDLADAEITPVENTEEETQEEVIIVEEVENAAEEIVEEEEIPAPVLEETVNEVVENNDKIEINYDGDEEVEADSSNFTEAPIDRNAPIIEAPKVKLDGLKILGKIELPTKKVETKEEETENVSEEDEIAALDAAMQSSSQDIKRGSVAQKPVSKEVKDNLNGNEDQSPFKDKRGIYHFSAEQKANRAKHLLELDKRKKEEARKEAKRRHYKEQVANKAKPVSTKVIRAKEKKTENTKQKQVIKQKKEQPKGLWQRFKSWLND